MVETQARTPEQVKAWLAENIEECKTWTRSDKSAERIRWRVAGTLDKWLGKAPRRFFINHLFPHSDGSTKPLTYEELAALDDWMALRYDPMNGYMETPASAIAKQEMLAIVGQLAFTDMLGVETR